MKKLIWKATLDNTNYEHAIEVESIDGIQFATGDDSGSLHFIFDSTAKSFVPVRMNVWQQGKWWIAILWIQVYRQLTGKYYWFRMCDWSDCQEEN